MRKYLLYVSFLAVISCGNKEKKESPAAPVQAALTKSANSDAFNRSFEQLLRNYYSLKDNFIAEEDSAISQSARKLIVSTDSLPLKELKADSNLISTANTYTLGISSELKGLLGEKDIEAKRRSFQMVSDQLYDLIRTVQYDQAVIYHPFCATAFPDQGANWLSNSPEIRNPYSPGKMINCGEVKDSIDFRIKNRGDK